MLSEEETLELARKSINYDSKYKLTSVHFETVCIVHMSYISTERLSPPAKPETGIDQKTHADNDIELEPLEVIEPGMFNEPVGHCPFLIDKRSGEIYDTGTAVLYSDEHYAAAYLDCGDPCGEATSRLRINGCREGAERNQAIRLLHTACGLGLREAKEIIDEVFQQRCVNLEAKGISAADALAKQLTQMGFLANQRYKGQYHNPAPDLLDDALLDEEAIGAILAMVEEDTEIIALEFPEPPETPEGS